MFFHQPSETSKVLEHPRLLLYASGNSMIGDGIDDGDMVLVRWEETAHEGEIVVAYVEGEDNMFKRLPHELTFFWRI